MQRIDMTGLIFGNVQKNEMWVREGSVVARRSVIRPDQHSRVEIVVAQSKAVALRMQTKNGCKRKGKDGTNIINQSQ